MTAYPSATSTPVPDDELSPYVPFRIALQYRYLILAAAVVGGVIAAATAPYDSYSYTAEATFLPQGSPDRGLGGAAAVAGQLGLGGARGSVEQSPEFYADLLISRRILNQVLQDTFSVAANPQTGSSARSGPLWEILGAGGQTTATILYDGRDRLRSAIGASAEDGIVELSVKTEWPDLSGAVAARLIELVEEFNAETRRTGAAEESRFLEERLAESEALLRNAEDRVRAFLETYRQFETSPRLAFEYERLQRDVVMQQEIFMGLAESYALAQSAAVRDTPLITVVELPEPPARADSRGILRRGIVFVLMGAVLGLFFAFIREFFRGTPTSQDVEFQRFRAAWADTLNDFRLRRGLGAKTLSSSASET